MKLSLSLAMLFPLYALFYITFPASLVTLYIISAVLFAGLRSLEGAKEKVPLLKSKGVKE